MKTKKVFLVALLFSLCACLAFGMFGCNGNNDSGTDNEPKITLKVVDKSLEIYSTFQLEAETENLDGVAIVWTSSDPDVASVSDSGLVTANFEGIATITATAGSASATCSITVTNSHAVPQLMLSQPSQVKLAIGEKLTITATTKYQSNNVPNVNYNWSLASTDADDVVTLTLSADTRNLEVEGLSFGTVTVTCRAICNAMPIQSTVKISVYNDNVSFEVVDLTEGLNGYQVSLSLFDDEDKGYINQYAPSISVSEGGSAVDASQIVWTVVNPDIATVENGVIKANKIGNTLILAEYEGNGVYFDLTVVAAKFDIAGTAYVEFSEGDSFVLSDEVEGEVVEVYYNGSDIFDSYDSETGKVYVRTTKLSDFGVINGGLRILTDKAEYNTSAEYVAMVINDKEEFKKMPEVAWELGDKTPEEFRVQHPTLGGLFYLGNDIDFEGDTYDRKYNATGWSMLGGFFGTFDGKGYNVDNIVMPSGGIFNFIAQGGVFKNVTFTNAVLDASSAILLQRGFITDWCNGSISNVYVQYKEVKVATEAYTFYGGAHTSENIITNVMVVADKITNTVGSGTVKFDGIGYADTPRSFVGNVQNSVFVTGTHEGVETVTGYKNAGTLSGVAVPAELVETTASSINELNEIQANWDSSFWTIVNGIPVPKNMLDGNEIVINNTQTIVGTGDLVINTSGMFVEYKLETENDGITISGNVVHIEDDVKNATFKVIAFAIYDETIKDEMTFTVPNTEVVSVNEVLYAEVTDITAGVTLAQEKVEGYRADYTYVADITIDLSEVEYDGEITNVMYAGKSVDFTVNEQEIVIAKSIFGGDRDLVNVSIVTAVSSGDTVSKYTTVNVPVYLADYVILTAQDFVAMPYVSYTLGKGISDSYNTDAYPFLAGHIVLADDIDMAGVEYDLVYVHNDRYGGFRGVFDGESHIIDNLTSDSRGIFSAMLGSSEMKDVIITNAIFNGDVAWGGFLTRQRNAKITNVYIHIAEARLGGTGLSVFCTNNFNPALPVDNVVTIIDKITYINGFSGGRIYAGGCIYHEKLDETGVGNRLYDQVVVVKDTSTSTELAGWYTQPASGNTFTKPINSTADAKEDQANWDSAFWTVVNGMPTPTALLAKQDAVELVADVNYVGMVDVSTGMTAYKDYYNTYEKGTGAASTYGDDYSYSDVIEINLDEILVDGETVAVKGSLVSVKYGATDFVEYYDEDSNILSLPKSVFGASRGDVLLTLYAEEKVNNVVISKTNVTVPLVLADFVISTADDFMAMQWVADIFVDDTYTFTPPGGSAMKVANMGGYIVLANNIDLSGKQYKVHPNSLGHHSLAYNSNNGFSGVLDGRGYNVDNLTIAEQTNGIQVTTEATAPGFTTKSGTFATTGLFASLTYGARIKNISFTNGNQLCAGGGFLATRLAGFPWNDKGMVYENVYVHLSSVTGIASGTGLNFTAGVFSARANTGLAKIVNCIVKIDAIPEGMDYFALGGFTDSYPQTTNTVVITSGGVAKTWQGAQTPSGTTVYTTTKAAADAVDTWSKIIGTANSSFWTIGEDNLPSTVQIDLLKKNAPEKPVIPAEPANTAFSIEKLGASYTNLNVAVNTDTQYVKDGTMSLKMTLSNTSDGRWSLADHTKWSSGIVMTEDVNVLTFQVYATADVRVAFYIGTGGNTGSAAYLLNYSKGYSLKEGWNEVVVNFDTDLAPHGASIGQLKDGIVRFGAQAVNDNFLAAGNPNSYAVKDNGTILYCDAFVATKV